MSACWRTHVDVDLDLRGFNAVRRESPRFGLTDTGGGDADDLHAHWRLRGRFSRNIGDPDRSALQIERHLAVACLAAARANLFERGLDVASDPVLGVKLEAEEATHRDHDRSGQAHQYLYH